MKEKNSRSIIYLLCGLLLVAVILSFSLRIFFMNKETATEYISETSGRVFPYTFIDYLGNKVTVRSLDSVVILYGSFAEAWINGGGSITGTTQDAVAERKLELGKEVKIVGSVKEPNLEEIIALNPTLVIMSADVASQRKLGESFKQMDIPHAYIQIDVFEDYLDFLRLAADLNGREDLYQRNGLEVKAKIDNILSKIPEDKEKSILFLRAFSTGAKAKTDDNFVGIMLEELGTDNIASRCPSLLEELSIEEIIKEDPEYIFVTTMGDEDRALEALQKGIGANPAWKSLSAVKNDKFIVLPKELFHYKPNARWNESYEYLAKLLYPEVFSE